MTFQKKIASFFLILFFTKIQSSSNTNSQREYAKLLNSHENTLDFQEKKQSRSLKKVESFNNKKIRYLKSLFFCCFTSNQKAHED